MRTSLLRLVVVLACLCLPWAAEGKTRRLAVVVGNNSSQEAGLEALKFADDDAMQYAWFFRFVADEVWLHVRPDEESAAMHPNEETAGPPTRDAVLATLDAAVEKAQAWADAGDEVVVYLLFSGHGSYDAEGKGFLHLEDGKLTTRDLFYHLIGRTEDFFAVLVIDACNAGFLVKSKGPGRRAAGETTLEIEQYGNVGLVLASSPTGEVREWGRYLAGIFSHQVRSALSGAADVDADGKVSFQELASFVEAANRAVTNPALKLTPYIRPPLSRPGLPLVDFSDALFTQYLSVQLDHAGKVAVYDQELVRVADFHLDAGVAAKVALAGTGEHFVAVDGKEYRVPAGTRGTVALGDLAVDEEPQVAVRGVDEYYSKHLFAIPYSPEFARQYLAADYEAGLVFTREYEREWYENPLGWAGVGVGAALLGAGIYFYVAAADERDLALLADWGEDRAVHNDRVGTYNDLTIAAGVAGGAAAAAGVALFILDRPTYSVEFAPRVGSGLTVAPLPGGVMVEQRF